MHTLFVLLEDRRVTLAACFRDTTSGLVGGLHIVDAMTVCTHWSIQVPTGSHLGVDAMVSGFLICCVAFLSYLIIS